MFNFMPVNQGQQSSASFYLADTQGAGRTIEGNIVSQVALTRLEAGVDVSSVHGQSGQLGERLYSSDLSLHGGFHSLKQPLQRQPSVEFNVQVTNAVTPSPEPFTPMSQILNTIVGSDDIALFKVTLNKYSSLSKEFSSKLNALKKLLVRDPIDLDLIKQMEEEDSIAVDHLWKLHLWNMQNVIRSSGKADWNVNFVGQCDDETGLSLARNINRDWVLFKMSLNQPTTKRFRILEEMARSTLFNLMKHMITLRTRKLNIITQITNKSQNSTQDCITGNSRDPELTAEDWSNILEVLSHDTP